MHIGENYRLTVPYSDESSTAGANGTRGVGRGKSSL